jgi:hypothetical protein
MINKNTNERFKLHEFKSMYTGHIVTFDFTFFADFFFRYNYSKSRKVFDRMF